MLNLSRGWTKVVKVEVVITKYHQPLFHLELATKEHFLQRNNKATKRTTTRKTRNILDSKIE